MKLKVYTIHRGMVTPGVVEALGLPRHIQHADVVIVAETKLAAVEMTGAARGVHRVSERELRLASGATADAYQRAGLYDRPRVLVTAGIGHPSDGRVIETGADSTTTLVGYLHYGTGEAGRYTRRFVSITPVFMWFTTDVVERVVHIPRSAWEVMTAEERRLLLGTIAQAAGVTEWTTSEPVDGGA